MEFGIGHFLGPCHGPCGLSVDNGDSDFGREIIRADLIVWTVQLIIGHDIKKSVDQICSAVLYKTGSLDRSDEPVPLVGRMQ